MRKMDKRILAVVCGVFVTVFVTGCRPAATSDEPLNSEVWRFAIEEAEGSVQHEYAMRFKEMIEDGTSGKS